jgi:hypothetical protein
MGASASIEVSFIDKKTGLLLSDQDINLLTNEAQKIVDSFDFSPSFYDHYKKPDAYKILAQQWKNANESTLIQNNITTHMPN